MADVIANVTFEHAGEQVRVGDIFDDSHFLYTMFPTRFTVQADAADFFSGGSLSADLAFDGTLGPVLNSTDGTLVYRLTVNDGGTITAEEA
jgi:hypothetical protein